MKLLALLGAGLIAAGTLAVPPASAQHYRGGHGYGYGHGRHAGYGYDHGYRRGYGYGYGYRRERGYRHDYAGGYGRCRVFYRHGYRERRCY